jgi:hypothetical protein
MRAIQLLVFAAMVVSVPQPSAAQSSFWQGPLPDRSTRASKAAEWFAGFSALEKEVPTLSPSEKDWLSREYDAQIAGGTYTTRALAAAGSREYNIRLVRERLDEVLPILKRLASRDPMGLGVEVGLWAELTGQFVDSSFWQAVEDLVSRKITSPKINGIEQLYFENHAGWARGVLSRIVVPHLSGRLK